MISDNYKDFVIVFLALLLIQIPEYTRITISIIELIDY